MKLVSWNVNGLRAVHRNGYWNAFLALDADIYCLQEIKAEPEQLPDDVRAPEGFHAYFNPAQSKKGYSGVAVYAKQEPKTVEQHLGEEHLDREGRLLTLYFDTFALCNVYFPNGGQGPERLAYKLAFYDAFLDYIENIRSRGLHVIFCGDVNTAHEAIDLARPRENESNTGFLPEERAWLDTVVRAGYTDTFRHLNPRTAEAYSYWDLKTRARERNVGWRIDYIFVSNTLVPSVRDARIHPDVYGSDHCPVSAIIETT